MQIAVAPTGSKGSFMTTLPLSDGVKKSLDIEIDAITVLFDLSESNICSIPSISVKLDIL